MKKVQKKCVICKHLEKNHQHRDGDYGRLSDICWTCRDWEFKKYHVFKMDNLHYVERLAKIKGLI